MSNRVEDLERQVAELQAAVNGLTEELVEMKERVRQLEDERSVAVEEAAAAGIEYFIFVTGRGKSTLVDHFDHVPELENLLQEKGKERALRDIVQSMPQPGRVMATRQQDPLGLGHAVWCARAFVGDEPFAVILPDDLVLANDRPAIGELIDAHAEVGGNVVAVDEVPRERTSSYGILDVDKDDGRIASAKGLVEKPAPEAAPSNLAIIGRYVLDGKIFDYLEKQGEGAGGEIQLTDAMAAMIGEMPLHGTRFTGRRFDCGDKVGYLEANIAFALEHEELGDKARAMLDTFTR